MGAVFFAHFERLHFNYCIIAKGVDWGEFKIKRIVSIFHSLSKSRRAIHKLSCDSVSVVQSTIVYEILLLKNPSMQMAADAVEMDITTFLRQIRTLEEKGFVVRTPFEGDRRIYIDSLTDKGKQMVESTNEVIIWSFA